MARRDQEGPRREDVPTRTGAPGDDPEARWRRAAARYPNDPGPGGADRRQAGAGADLRGDLDPAAYGYRPKRSGTDAIKEVHALLCRGYTEVVDADLSKYFDRIPHQDLMRSVARRIVDRHVLQLIKLWLKAPVEERDGDGTRRMTGDKGRSFYRTAGSGNGVVVASVMADVAGRGRCGGQGLASSNQILRYTSETLRYIRQSCIGPAVMNKTG